MSLFAGVNFFNKTSSIFDVARNAISSRAQQRHIHPHYWCDQSTLLMHATAAQIPPSPRLAPKASPDGCRVIVFDGQIHNGPQLCRELGLPVAFGAPKHSLAIVLAAWETWGAKCWNRLLGDFSCAIWDNTRRQLVCARDSVGSRPLYYRHTSEFFAFSNDEEFLAGMLPGDVRASAEWMAFHLVPAFHDLDLEQSMLEGIRVLQPAHSIVVHAGGRIERTAYWSYQEQPELRLGSDAEYQEAFREVFEKAVACRVNDDREPAALISGGMDSAALAAILGPRAKQLPGGFLQAYSVMADDIESSIETRCISKLTATAGVRANSIFLPSQAEGEWSTVLKDAAWGHAHPVGNHLLIQSVLCEQARRNKHSRLLYAPSGDLVTGDPLYLSELLRNGQWALAWRESQAASKHHTYLRHHRPGSLILRAAWGAYAPLFAKLAVRKERRRRNEVEGLRQLNPVFAKELRIEERIRVYQCLQHTKPDPGFRAIHAESLFGPAGVTQGLVAGHMVASRYGVEMHDPWADRRVMEFFLRLPLNQLVRDGWTKFLVRSTFAQQVGAEVCWRSDKEHLGWQLVRCLLEGSRDEIGDFLNTGINVLDPYLDIAPVRTQFQRSVSSPAELWNLYRYMTLGLWLQRLMSLRGGAW